MEKKRLEKDILREICEWLQEHGYFFWRSNNIPVFGMSNDGVRRFRAMPKYSLKGLPDIMIISKGKLIGIEVKREGLGLKPEQEKIRKEFFKNGAFYFLCSNVSDIRIIFTIPDYKYEKN